MDQHCSPGVCGANLPMHHTIGDEFTWAREGMTDELLCKDGLQVSEVTTDPDSSAGRAADSSTRTVCCKKACPFHQHATSVQDKLVNFALNVADR